MLSYGAERKTSPPLYERRFGGQNNMLTAIVGVNWGDEGKGRMVDLLSERCDVVVRYQGGNNAGHTVVNEIGRAHV